MFSLFRREKTNKPNLFLALDIGTEFVKALNCEAQGNIAVIRGFGKTHQSLGDMQSGAVMDIGGVIENCSKAIEKATDQAEGYPTEVIIGIAGELVKGVTSRNTYIRKEPHTKIDLGELKNIIHKIQWKSFEETRGQLAYETGYNEIDIKLVNAAIVDVRIDGYRVTNPIGFQGKEVQISIFNAFAPLVHYGALQTIAAELDLNLLTITAEPYAVARCLENENPDPLNAIFIDIGGGTTDIAIVRNGSLEGTKMFTLGGRAFTKRIASHLNISFNEAEEIKLAYSFGKLEKQSEKIVREAMESDAEVWLSGVAFTLSEFYNLDLLPPQILLCGGGCHLPEIKEALKTKTWTKELPFPAFPSISILNPKQIRNVRDTTKLLTNPEDITPMALANIGLGLVNEEYLMTKILKKVVRLMQI
ncbi:pilus assembly protein PilM [Candidatus Peregrinibacteria bacterium]|nr:pilus assembly protein PilM [Candidatus Peregrinibacteria bacterium]